MWQLDNRTPYAAERTWVRDRKGAEVWLVAVKATFTIAPDGTTSVAAEQLPVTLAPEYLGEPGKSSLRYESDLVMTKRTTDVLLHGHAYAPNGDLKTYLDIGMRVGPVIKVLRVFGDRVWTTSGGSVSLSAPRPFFKMPIVWERAYGGIDAKADPQLEPAWDGRNPIGRGYAVASAHIDGEPAPHIEYPNVSIKVWSDRPTPAGFGPLSSHWQPRAQYAGTYDDAWLKTRMPLLPEDFDERFFQAAPADQQAPQFLRGGEPVVLRNLMPGSGDLRFYLPRVFLGFETFFNDGSRELHPPPKLHSVILEPDEPRVSLVWHTALPCHPKVLKLRATRIIEKTAVGIRPNAAPADMAEDA